MRYILIVLLLISSYQMVLSRSLDDEKTKFKKVWKLQEMYFDSVAAPVDTTMQKYRLMLANDSICYLHDGTQPILCYWNLNTITSSIDLYSEEVMSSQDLFLKYKIIFINEQNLIVTIDLSNYNSPIKLVEYRLIPDADYVFD